VSDALADAIADAERDHSVGGSSLEPPADDSSQQQQEPEEPKRGRKRDPNSRRSRRGVYSGAPSSTSTDEPKVQGPPPPVDRRRVEYPPIDPAAVADSLQQLDAQISRALGTQPLTKAELLEGGGVFAPILDHYMPLLAAEGGMWVPAATFVVMAYGPRLWELMDNMQRRKKGLPPARTEAPAAIGDNGFSEPVH
jgi:hypothetical protein